MKAEGVSSKATTFNYIHSDWSPVPVPCKTNKALRRVPEPAGSDSSCSLWCNGDACNRVSSAPSPPVTMAATTAINAITMVPSIPKKPIWPLGHSLLDYISTTRRGTDVAWKKCHLVLLVLAMYF
jgi:hypothetical protein